MSSTNEINQIQALVLTLSDCQFSDARNTINDTPSESSLTSGGLCLFETMMNTVKQKVREDLEVEQPVRSVSLVLVETFRTLRTL